MALLDKVQKGPKKEPPRILLYGEEKIGKSSFGAQAPNPIFITTEDGISQLDCHSFPLATRFGEVMQAIHELTESAHDYKTVVVDSLDWLERLIWNHLCEEAGVRTIENIGGGYGRGYVNAVFQWQQFLDALNSLRLKRSMIVLNIAHAKTFRIEKPDLPAFDQYGPRLHKLAAPILCEWSDAILFATRKIRVSTEKGKFNNTRNIAKDIGEERILRCVGSASCIAGTRYDIRHDLPLHDPASGKSSWQEFVNACKKSTSTSNPQPVQEIN